MKYTVSIADDEPRVRTGLRSLITSRGEEWEVSGLFPDGSAALRAAAARPTDVILADIRMPDLDGLSLAQALRTVSPDTVVVVMSGYKEFDYARRAMKAGVLDFIVKPIEEEELFAVLDRARREIDRRRADRRQAVLTRDPDAVRDALLAEVLASADPAKAGMRLCEYLGTDLGSFVVLCAEALPPGGEAQRAAAWPPTLAAGALPAAAQVFRHHGRLVVLLPLDEAAGRRVASAAGGGTPEAARSATAALHAAAGGGARIGVSAVHAGCGLIPEAFEQSLQAAHRGYYDAAGRVFTFVPAVSTIVLPYPASAQSRLCACLVTGDRTASEAAMRELLLPYRQARAPLPLLEEHVGAVLRSMAEAVSPILADGDGLKELMDTLTPVLRHGWFERLETELVRAVGALCGRVEQANRNRLGRAVRRAVRFIEDNFSRDLPLEEIAKSAGLSPSYFSSTFKKETGRNVVEYLTEYRLEKSLKLLGSTNLNTSEVAYRVGFNDPKYFARIFKRSIGVTPSDYRRYSREA